MHQLLLQFYATPRELATFLRDLMRQGLVVVITKRPAFAVHVATEADIDPDRLNAATHIGIVRGPPEVSSEDWDSFVDGHRNALFLRVGRLENQVLAQSWLSSQSPSEAEIKHWRKVAYFWKKRTTAGVWVGSPTTKAVGFYKQYRFTEGALALFDDGCRMAPPAGNNLVYLRDPHADSPAAAGD